MQGKTSNGNDPKCTDPILKFNETIISIADETYQRPRQTQNIQENHCLMINAKMPSTIAKRPNDGSENIQHRTTSAISVSSGRKLEEL
jgi:hypothetical protein